MNIKKKLTQVERLRRTLQVVGYEVADGLKGIQWPKCSLQDGPVREQDPKNHLPVVVELGYHLRKVQCLFIIISTQVFLPSLEPRNKNELQIKNNWFPIEAGIF